MSDPLPSTRFSALLHALGADLTALARQLDAGEITSAQAEDQLRASANHMDEIEQNAEQPQDLPTPQELRQWIAEEAHSYAAARACDDC